jgi:hypothetical protein
MQLHILLLKTCTSGNVAFSSSNRSRKFISSCSAHLCYFSVSILLSVLACLCRSIRVPGLAVLFLVFCHARAAAAADGARDQDDRLSSWSTCSPKTTMRHCWPSVPRHRRCREVQLKLERLHRRFSPWRRSCSTSSLADSRQMVSYCRCFGSDLLG